MKGSYLQRLKDLVVEFLKDEDVKVVLFGSRARDDHTYLSDVDIAIIPGSNFDRKKISLLKEYIEESTIPYKIDIIDLSVTSPDFRETAIKEGEVWKD